MNRSVEYREKKRALARTLQEIAAKKGTVSLYKSTSNLFRNRKKSQSQPLDVRGLNQVISIDPKRRIAEVEAMIPYEDLVKETLKLGLLPAVVPQLKTITVGGALVGLGIESSSFRYGLVHETLLEIEALTGTGDVVVCRPDNEYRDLFYALPNSYGTLGLALKIQMQLIPARKYVRLTNSRFNDAQKFFEALETLSAKKRAEPDDSFVDGVIFSNEEMYIVLGEFTDEAPFTSDYTYMSSYYESIRKKEVNYLTASDYIWRWDPDWFWCSKHFGMDKKLLRLLFGKFMLHSATYWKIKRLAATNPVFRWLIRLFEKPSESVIQDILIPAANALPFFDFLQQSIGVVPIWVCPTRGGKRQESYTLCRPVNPSTLYFDFGFWDIVRSDKPKGFLNRQIERKTEELSGFKGLYSDSFYSEEEFWRIYPKGVYSQLKDKYDPARVFKDLYAKCVHCC